MPPIVFSSSAIAAFKRCPKSYEFGYELLLEPEGTVKDYVQQGSEVHEALAAYYNNKTVDYSTDMYCIADEYFKHNTMPHPDNVLSVEEPLYTKIYEHIAHNCWLRTTFDLVYEREDGTVVARDYKTFERAPTIDVDLDFQSRIYIAALQKKYPDRQVEFEFVYIRRVPPGTKNSKGFCTPEDCYLTVPVVVSRHESDQIWKETGWVIRAMLEARRNKEFWRSDLKVGPHSCGSCFYRNLCKAELQHGHLDEQDLALLAPTRREPIQIPKELYDIPV